MKQKYLNFNSNQIKLTAIIAMTIDHLAWLIFPGFSQNILAIGLHIIGRLTCPIMCYCIAEGYHYTRNINKYTLRLSIMAVVSHFAYVYASADYIDFKSFIPFYYGNYFNATSVIWSLLWGLIMLRVVNSNAIKHNFLKVAIVLLICIITFPADWSCIGSLFILAFGLNRGEFKKQMIFLVIFTFFYSVVYFFAIDRTYGIIQMGVFFAVPFLTAYNGKRGKNPNINKWMKWLFYVYYPLHLFIIGLIQNR